jgi:hypothetical protein
MRLLPKRWFEIQNDQVLQDYFGASFGLFLKHVDCPRFTSVEELHGFVALDDVQLLDIKCLDVFGYVIPLFASFCEAARSTFPFTTIAGSTLNAGGIVQNNYSKLGKLDSEIMMDIDASLIVIFDSFCSADVLQLLHQYQVVEESILDADFAEHVCFIYSSGSTFFWFPICVGK